MDKIYFKRLAIILESMLKLVETNQKKMKIELEDFIDLMVSVDKMNSNTFRLVFEFLKNYGKKIDIDISELKKISNERHIILNKIGEERLTKMEYFSSEIKLFSKEIEDIQQDITDFIKKIDTDKID